MSGLYATILAANAADDAWHASLVEAFGPHARTRRYDADDSAHPEKCQRLRREFMRAMLNQDAAWRRARAIISNAPEAVQ